MRIARRPARFVLGLALLAALAARGAAQEPRIDYARPVVGETFQVTVDRVPPRAAVLLYLNQAGEPPLQILAGSADASGCARFEFQVPPRMVGPPLSLSASFGDAGDGRGGARLAAGMVGPVEVRFQRPQLLVAGDRDGRAAFSRLEATGVPAAPFVEVETLLFPPGRPLGAARDGRGTRSFFVRDADQGVVVVIKDQELGGGVEGELLVGADVRGIATTPDGGQILITSAGGPLGAPVLTVLDTRAAPAVALRTIPLEPLGPGGGRIVVSDDGLRAFVAVRGLYLREINLLREKPGALIAVGGAGDDEVLDLRVADGHLFALTGRGERMSFMTGLEIGDFRNVALEGPAPATATARAALGVGRSGGAATLLLLNGQEGRITVIDARTMRRRGEPLAVRPGAAALLLPPNPAATTAALVYAATGGSELVPFDLESFAAGSARRVPFAAAALPLIGSSAVDHLFVADGGGGLVAVEPLTLLPFPLDLPFTALSLSVAH